MGQSTSSFDSTHSQPPQTKFKWIRDSSSSRRRKMSPLPFSDLTNEIVDLTMDTSAAMRETGDTWTMFMGVVVTLLPKIIPMMMPVIMGGDDGIKERFGEDDYNESQWLNQSMNQSTYRLITGHFIEGLLKLDADFAVFLLPLVELSDEEFQLLRELGSLALSRRRLDFRELEIQYQISDFLLGLLVAFEGVGLGQLESFHVLSNDVELFFQIVDLPFGFFVFFRRAVELNLGHGELSRNFLGVSGGSEGDLAGSLNGFLQGVHSLVIHEGLSLQGLPLNLHSFRCCGSLGQLVALDLETAVGTGDIVVEKRESTLES